jgi:hypothetical protein
MLRITIWSLALSGILSGCSTISDISETLKKNREEQRKTFQQYEGEDAAKVIVQKNHHDPISGLRFCQQGNYGWARDVENHEIKVKPNEPTRISFNLTIRDKYCNVSALVNFPASSQYHITGDIKLNDQSFVKTLVSGLNGSCNIYLTEDGNYFNQRPAPFASTSCQAMQEQNPDETIKGVIPAKSWVTLNKLLKPK